MSFTNLWASAAMLFAQLLKSTSLNQSQRDSAQIAVRELSPFSVKADIPTITKNKISEKILSLPTRNAKFPFQ